MQQTPQKTPPETPPETSPSLWPGSSRLVAAARRRPLLVWIVLLVVVSLPFLVVGHALDTGMAGWFGDASGFPLEDDEGMGLLRDLNRWFAIATVLVCLGALVAKIARPTSAMRLRPRAIVFLLSTLIVGPGLVANTLFKDNWGRPRPRQIVEFGGEAPYTLPWVITDHCERNCSFISGEGASGIWTVAPALLSPMPERPFVVLAAIGWGVVMGLVRIAMGGHFLSDVLIGAVIMLIVIWAIRRLLWTVMPERRDAAMADGLGRLGLRLRSIGRRR